MRAILCMLLLWQTCAPLCMPRPIGLPYFTSSLRWQTCAPLCMPCPISQPFFASSLLWKTYIPLCTPRQIGLPISLRRSSDRHAHVLAADLRLFSFSWDLTLPLLCPNGSCACTRHDTIPPWYKLKAVWIFFRCKTETRKFMCGRLPGKRIVCSASKVTTCSSVYQTCQVVVNSMLHQQGDNTVIMYQSCHATASVKQDDSHYK
jgi:hypothetical protein